MHVDLQERHQLDIARQHVAKVKARARPWQSIFAIILAVIAAAVSTQARHTADRLAAVAPGQAVHTMLSPLGRPANVALEYGLAAAFFLLAGFGTIGLGNKAREVLQPTVGSAHAAVIRFATLIVGGLATMVVTLELLNIDITQLVLGGAVTGVLLGIAAQQSLANVFAGIVLLMARPFQVGDRVAIRAGALSGLLEGTVTEVSVTYVRLETPNGPVHVPNSQVLAAAVGPAGSMPLPPGQSPPPAQGIPSGQGAQPPSPGSAPGEPGTSALPAALTQERVPPEPGTPPAGPGTPPAEPATPAGSSAAQAGPSGPAEPESPGSEPQHDTGRQPS
jgi:hypothetical protein